jgi:hypothetical protein
MATHWTRPEEIVCEELDGELLLVQIGTRRMWRLNAAAAALWRACNGKTQRLSAECAAFCQRLEVEGLLTRIGAPAFERTGAALRICGPLPQMQELSFGAEPRRRPSPRGISGGPG